MKRIAIFVSGNGTNCENIIKHFAGSASVEVALVLSNKPEAFALERAKRLGVATAVMPKSQFNDPDTILPLLREARIDFIVLAGFLLMVPTFLVAEYEGRMLNIHPSLLPRHGGKGMYGKKVHEAVKNDGDNETGITIHWVSQVCDGGTIIAQFSTPVAPTDTVEDIEAKVHDLEKRHYPDVIEKALADV